MRIKFIKNYKVSDATGKEYNAGDTLTCSVDTARHFMNRGVAEEFVAPKRPAAKKVTSGNARSS